MIAILKPGATDQQREHLIGWLRRKGVDVHISDSDGRTVLGLTGDIDAVDIELLRELDIVESAQHISEPFKQCSRRFHPADTVIDITGARFGGGSFGMIAGPCSVETREQMISVAHSVKEAGAVMLRGGAFKPRTSPYDFQGLMSDGLSLLLEAKRETGLPIVSEIMSASQLELFADVDVIQVGARNMQNFDLLKALGHTDKPILLKRGISATLTELLMSAEYIMSGGNSRVILCERGIRTFDRYTRNTIDLSAVPVLHELTHLPVIVDPSHATGHARLVEPMALAAAACGADGLMIEVHNDPARALCDGEQSLTPDQFARLCEKTARVREAAK